MSLLRTAIRYGAYPVLLAGGLVVLWALRSNGAAITWAPYVAVAVFGPLVRDVEHTFRTNKLACTANSSHVALHMSYTLGCRNLFTVGCGSYQGKIGYGYDRRLSHYVEQQIYPPHYVSSFNGWAGLFDWKVTRLDW